MSAQRYTEEFKVEAVNQVLDRGHSVAEVANVIGMAAVLVLSLRFNRSLKRVMRSSFR